MTFCDNDHDYIEVIRFGAEGQRYSICSKCLGACLILPPNPWIGEKYMTQEEIRDSKVLVCHIGFVSGMRKTQVKSI